MLKTDNTKPSSYARLERKVGWYDEYSGSPVHYHVGHCDSCGLKNVSFSEGYDNKTEGAQFCHNGGGDAWALWHNQTHHQAETRPRVQAATPAVSVHLVCGHSYGKVKETDASTKMMNAARKSLSNEHGVCGRNLRRYTGSWDHDRPLYVCDFGHYNDVPETVDRKQLNQRVRGVNAHLTDMHEGFGVDAKIAELEAKKRQLKR